MVAMPAPPRRSAGHGADGTQNEDTAEPEEQSLHRTPLISIFLTLAGEGGLLYRSTCLRNQEGVEDRPAGTCIAARVLSEEVTSGAGPLSRPFGRLENAAGDADNLSGQVLGVG